MIIVSFLKLTSDFFQRSESAKSAQVVHNYLPQILLKIICNINWFRGDKTGIMSTPNSNIKIINYVWLAFILSFKIHKILVQFNNNYIHVCIFTFIYLLRSYAFYSTCLGVRAYHAEGVSFFLLPCEWPQSSWGCQVWPQATLLTLASH